MLRSDFGDPTTFWLNTTNLALAVATGLCLVVVIGGAIVECWRRRGDRLRGREGSQGTLWWAKRQFSDTVLPPPPHDW